MSQRDDEGPKTEKRASIPAPKAVPRPSKPPGERISALPPSGRKGTLDGVQPAQAGRAPILGGAGAYGGRSYQDPSEEDFDAEKTTVVDPDDAPTADYDPRTAGMSPYDPRMRGVYNSPPSPPDLSGAEIPPAPAAPSFEAEQAPAIPAPRPSRRTSRRTVKIPDDQVKRQAEPKQDGPAPLTSVEQVVQQATSVADLDYGDEGTMSDEITIVKPLRIISIGSDPPPPIRTALATWPPPADGAPAPLGLAGHGVGAYPEPIESGWTPAAPPVELIESQALGEAAQIIPPAAGSGPSTTSSVVAGQNLISGPAVVQASTAAPAAPVAAPPATPPPPVAATPVTPPVQATPPQQAAPPVQAESAMDRISDVSVSEREEILEEIEPDAAPIAPAQAKKPPPPPPKTKQPAASTVPEPPTKKGKSWWEDIFSDEYLRTMDRLDEKIVRREVDFIEESLGMEKHAVVLDLACGPGDHAVELAARGYSVVGLDYSTGMLSMAEHRVKQRTKAQPGYVGPQFVQGDMRELAYEEAFDGVYCWSTSFGYFDEEKNLQVLAKIHRALRQGGMFLIDIVNRDYIAPRSPSLVWFEGQQCVCMDDMFVDFFSSRLRVKRTAMFEGGLSRELDYSIRLYTLHELGKLLHEVGFKVVEVTGHPAHPGVFFGTESPRLIVLAERA